MLLDIHILMLKENIRGNQNVLTILTAMPTNRSLKENLAFL